MGPNHPGAHLSLFEETDGWALPSRRHQHRTGQLAFFEARHRAQAAVEDRIRHAKGYRLGRFSSRDFKIN